MGKKSIGRASSRASNRRCKLKMIERVITSIANATWVVFVVVTAAQVFLRYVLGAPLFWTEELARFSLVWFTFLGTIILMINDDHIRVGFLAAKLQGRLKLVTQLIRHSTEMSVAIFLLYGSWTLLPATISATTPALGMSIALWYAAGTVAGVGILVVAARSWFVTLRGIVPDNLKRRTLQKSSDVG